jgi:hypothetical protein
MLNNLIFLFFMNFIFLLFPLYNIIKEKERNIINKDEFF